MNAKNNKENGMNVIENKENEMQEPRWRCPAHKAYYDKRHA